MKRDHVAKRIQAVIIILLIVFIFCLVWVFFSCDRKVFYVLGSESSLFSAGFFLFRFVKREWKGHVVYVSFLCNRT